MTMPSLFLRAVAVPCLIASMAAGGAFAAEPAASTPSPEPSVIQIHPLAPAIYQIAYSAKQHAVFVASAGGAEPDAPPPRVFKLDPETLAVQAEIQLPHHGLGLTLDDEADRLYLGNGFEGSVTVLDTRSHEVIAVVQLMEKVTAPDHTGKVVERYPHNLRELVLDKANHRLFAPGIYIRDSVLYVMDTQKLALETVLPGFGYGVAGATLDAERGKLYVGNMQGQLFTVDARTLEVERTDEVQADQLLNLAFDHQQERVLASDHGSPQPDMVREKFAKLEYTKRGEGNRVAVIDPASGAVDEYLDTGRNPLALLIDEARHRLFVTNRGSATVTVHDSRDHRLLHTFSVAPHPNSLALDPATGTVYVTVKNPMDADKKAPEGVAKLVLPVVP